MGEPRPFIRILHLGNTANVPRTLANYQKQMGHAARVIAVQTDAFKGEADEVLSGSGPLGWNLAMRRLRVEWQEIEAIHVHGGIWLSQLYYYRLRARARKSAWVVHLHGSETRSGKGLHHLRLADAILCSTPDLRRFVPAAQWLPNPVGVPDEIPSRTAGDRTVIGHFPSDRRVKGTDHILDALVEVFGPPEERVQEAPRTLRWSWKEVDFLLADRVSHATVLRLIETCDAVVDHLSTLGPVGLVSLEAMARGRAALSSYDTSAYPADCPVIPLTFANVHKLLGEIVADRQGIMSAGRAGRTYVQRHHSPNEIARKSISIYQATSLTRTDHARDEFSMR